MRPLQFLALSGLMLASNVALAAELDRDDVPNRCWDVCSPVVGIAQQCDNMHRDDDRAEMNCICDWNQAPTLVPLCEACISQFRNDTRNGTRNDNGRDNDRDHDRDDDHHDDHDDRRGIHDNDAYDILTSCSFSTTTYNAAAATSILSTATGTISPTPTNNAGGSTGSGGNTGNSQSSNTNNGGNAQPNNNAATGATVPKAASVAAVVGLIGLAWL
ncbi:hypothetical protein ALT_6119 [Aspergillus lentulus]|uniref:GPI anchored protein n=1 Tax=Aspergillus lentulus TaxID=293939 RepID=A0AAN4TCA4_ASPLE|nr:uncharacterized protein IFM58399_01193 [Aspergillus lentulus]GAQ08798.1 hypothetical protein ALT_6119 [Aspergillus lentulus]GFF25856.1 hypothetical protein IFM58399_01193 [Aspergillus lentulus]GFF44967.1 hypothetical protein IFM62136_00130 [Aspergillus lentulus]GFF62004.1 hypothetical protein IFM60648_00483 [Aspergillus lentulus]GFF64802.1 hypothetical protein IFM47457_00812 [Aspergillus lentulus]